MHKGVLTPDLTIIIDMSVDSAMERVTKDSNRPHKEVFEQKEFQEEARRNFLMLPKNFAGRENSCH